MLNEIPNRKKSLGLEEFLNLLLFDNTNTPDLISDKYFPLSKKINEAFNNQSKSSRSDNLLGLRLIESTIRELTLNKNHRKTRREIVKCYNASFVRNIIDALDLDQRDSYLDNELEIRIDDWMLPNFFSTQPFIPYQIKCYLSNKFIDLFEHFNPRKDKISVIKYHRLLEKYLKDYKRTKIEENIYKHEIVY